MPVRTSPVREHRGGLHCTPYRTDPVGAVWTDFDLRSPALTRSIICLWDNSRCVRPQVHFRKMQCRRKPKQTLKRGCRLLGEIAVQWALARQEKPKTAVAAVAAPQISRMRTHLPGAANLTGAMLTDRRDNRHRPDYPRRNSTGQQSCPRCGRSRRENFPFPVGA